MSFSQQYSSEIESLKAQLAQKDKQIFELESKLKQNNSLSNSGSSNRAQAVLRREIESLQESIPSTDVFANSQISSILNEPSLETQISYLVSFLKSRLSAIPRLCAQLRGHVDFLTRLAASPKLQSLFLISDHNGSIFLQETARQLLLEQASRTSQFISDYPQLFNDASYERTSTINTSISFGNQFQHINPNERLQSIKKLLSDQIHDPQELSSLLLQEVLISSSLQRVSSDANKKLKQITQCLSSCFEPQNKSKKHGYKDPQNADFLIEEEEEEANEDIISNRNPDNDDFNFEKTLQYAQKLANLSSKNANLFNRDPDNLNSGNNNYYDNSNGNNNNNNNYDNSGKYNSQTRGNRNNNENVNYENQTRGNKNSNNSNYENIIRDRDNYINDSSAKEWTRWAKRLYHGLTQLPAESQDDRSLRMIIEEAALTQIGTQVLQSKLKSLRLQKSVMKPPTVNTSQKELGFSTPLLCVLSCLRMSRRAYSSNSYTTKRKVSLWSSKTVLNE